MVLWACPPGAVLVATVVLVDTEVDVLVEVDVFVVVLSEPQPTRAKLTATVTVAAIKCFFKLHLPEIGPAPAPATPE
jgi:hypothetical protein